MFSIGQQFDTPTDICVMYRPDQPPLSAQTDPADTFRFRDQMYREVIPEIENPQEAKSVYPGRPVWHAQADPVDTLRRVHNVDETAYTLIIAKLRP